MAQRNGVSLSVNGSVCDVTILLEHSVFDPIIATECFSALPSRYVLTMVYSHSGAFNDA